MTPDDMAQLHAASFTEARNWSAEEFAALLASPLCFAVGDVRSFALVRVVADEAELLTLATNPAFQRQSLARAVMCDWQDEAKRRGAASAFLEVAADNTAALALYQSCGFVETGRRPGYYPRTGKDDCDALLLSRRL